MARHSNKLLLFALAALFLSGACIPARATPDARQVENQVATSVALTITAIPSSVPPTNIPPLTSTPVPTQTEIAPPTPTFIIPTIVPPTATLTTLQNYACDIVDQRPYDDTKFRPNAPFEIKWTLQNTGTQKWEDGTYMVYQDGPLMTGVKEVDLPNLKPGEQYTVKLDAVAPAEKDRQIMVWAVVSPADKDSYYWMCYPYVRIIVAK